MTDRLNDISALRPDSLVGSFFHGDPSRCWQGRVVAEPRPGVYLVELFDWLVGASDHQELVPIENMTGWRFYDTAEWMGNAYEQDVRPWWDHARSNDAPETV